MLKENPVRVEETLKYLIAKCLRRDNFVLDPSCTFKDLGIDSLDVVHIMVSLEDSLNIEIVDKDLIAIKNMGAFINYLEKKVAEKRK
jgi:acyl carrier protein